MAITLSISGTNYSWPSKNDENWSTDVNTAIQALCQNVLYKSGGTFTLTSEIDFGSSYGLKSLYYKTRATNPASTGQFRLGNAETIAWRNAANSADLNLKANASDKLEYNSVELADLSSTQTFTTKTIDATSNTLSNITNAEIKAAAAIAVNKLAAVTASRALVSDASGFMSASAVTATELGYLSGVTSAVQTQINTNASNISTNASNLTTHEADTSTHGVTEVLGASEAQTVTNKTIVAANNTVTTAASGNLAATELNAALAELQGDIDTRALDSDLTTHIADTSTHGVAGAILGTTDSQIVTSKKFDDEIHFKEIVTPATPASGYKKLYPKSDGKLYTLNSAGEEVEVGSGIGQGTINYSQNPDFETNVTTGVTDGTNIISAVETIYYIRGSQSLRWDIGTGVVAGDYGVLGLNTIDNADKSKPLTLSFEYATDTNYTSDDVTIRVHDGSGYIEVNATEDRDGKLKATGGVTDIRKFIGQFYASDSTSYEIRFYVNSAPATASQIIVDNVRVGPESFYNMPIVGETVLIDASVTTSTGTMTNYTLAVYGQRVGDRLIAEGRIEFNGAPGTWTNPNIVLNGLNIDISKLGADSGNGSIGTAQLLDNGSVAYRGDIIYVDTTIMRIRYLSVTTHTGSAPIPEQDFSQTVPFTWASGDKIFFKFDVPILEWVNSSTAMSTFQANLQTVKARYTSTAADTVSAANIQDFATKVYDSHNAVTTGASWKFTAPASLTYNVRASIITDSEAWTTNHLVRLALYKNGSFYSYFGTWVASSSSTTNAAIAGQTSIQLSAGDYIDVRASSDVATNRLTTAGYNFIEIESLPDFTTIGVYSPYEVLSAVSNTATPSGSGIVTHTGHNVSLTPGTWELSGESTFGSSGGSAAFSSCEAYWSTASGSVSAPTYDNYSGGNGYIRLTSGSMELFTASLPKVIITVTSTTSIYVICSVTATTYANARITSRLTARRLK